MSGRVRTSYRRMEVLLAGRRSIVARQVLVAEQLVFEVDCRVRAGEPRPTCPITFFTHSMRALH